MAEPPTIPESPGALIGRADVETVTVADGPVERRQLIGRTLGKFTIVELIGSGGGGDVFRANQPELDRSAVIKVMHSRTRASSARTERFLREARLASRLDHPYAAHVYAFGAEPDGLLWIAMEHVRGISLSDLVEVRGPMPLDVFAPLFERLCEVVRSMHELGIVHRDIKPSNVMVIERAGQLLPKLLDFGIAKTKLEEEASLASSLDADPNLTQQGHAIGTPAYMAPEQWRQQPIDHRTDIYALGILAYRCIAGRVPFAAETSQALAKAHIADEPPALGVGSAALDDAIRKALAKTLDERWAIATDLSAAVRTAIGGAAVESVPLLDARVRDAWMTAGPQPIAEAIATLAAATSTLEADHAVHEVVDVICRWLAAIALASTRDQFGADDAALDELRDRAHSVVGLANAATWLALGRAAAAIAPTLPVLADVFVALGPLAELADRTSLTRRSRDPEALRMDVAHLGAALDSLTSLMTYRLVVGGDRGPEVWMGRRTGVREGVVVWGDSVTFGEVVLLDPRGRVAVRLGPLVRAHRPLPHGDVELFLIASAGRGIARLAATPWGFELEDEAAAVILDKLDRHETTSVQFESDELPYPGLAPYGRDDAKRYFGREREIEALSNRLIRAPLVAIVGPSGVGKSSFLHAGLAPRLHDYRVLAMRPGRDPMAALALLLERELAVPHLLEPTDDELLARLVVVASHAPRGVVLVVDQLEELATLCTPADRDRFERVLARIGTGPTTTARVIVAVRDDFASMLESSDGLRDRFEPFVLGALTTEALRRVLTEPARRAAYTIEAAVVDEVVAEIAGRAVALPLLCFTAARLWELRDREHRTLTRAAYDRIGGVGGAIATYADEVYASLGRREQATARALFARLVAPDGTRVPVSRRDLEGLEPGAHSVIERLVDARLLSTHEVSDDGLEAEIIEPIHECLAERWPMLVRWRSEDAADRALIADLRAATRRWQASARARDQLWRGHLVDDLRRLVAGSALFASEREFADASISASQRATRVRRAIIAAIGVAITMTASVLGYLSWTADRAAARAERAAAIAERRLTESVVAHGRRELGEGRTIPALAYFAEALRRGADDESLRLLIGLATMPWKHRLLSWHGGFDQITFALDESWFAVGDVKGDVRWWNSDGTQARVHSFAKPIVALAASRDGTRLVVALAGRVVILDRAGVDPDRELAVAPDIELARIGPGNDEVTVVRPGALDIVDLEGRVRRSIPLPVGAVFRFRANASVTSWVTMIDGTVRSTDATTGVTRILHPRGARSLTMSDDRKWIAFIADGAAHVMTVEGDGLVVIRTPVAADDVELSNDGRVVGIMAARSLHIHDVGGAARRVIQVDTWRRFAIEGDEVWLGGEDGRLRHWRGERLVGSYVAHNGSVDMVMRYGPGLLTSGADGSLAIWDPTTSQIEVRDEVCPGPYAKRLSVTQYLTSLVRCDESTGVIVGPRDLLVKVDRPREIDAVAASSRGNVGIARADSVEILDPAGRPIARRAVRATAIAFAGDDALVLVHERRVLRWAFARDELVTIADGITPAPITTLAWAEPAVIIGDEHGTAVRLVDSKVTATASLGIGIGRIVPSADGRWLVVRLDDGGSVVLSAGDLQKVSELARGGDVDAPPAFDLSGQFLVRASDIGISIFARETGETVVTLREHAGELDDPVTGSEPDTMHVMVDGAPGLLFLPRDRRPISEILAELDCRVPMRVRGVALHDATPVCR